MVQEVSLFSCAAQLAATSCPGGTWYRGLNYLNKMSCVLVSRDLTAVNFDSGLWELSYVLRPGSRIYVGRQTRLNQPRVHASRRPCRHQTRAYLRSWYPVLYLYYL